jgi:hypothetical protein
VKSSLLRLLFATVIAAAVIVVPAHAIAKAPAEVATISLDQTSPRLGDVVTFSLTPLSSKVKNVGVNVDCYQSGVLVFGWASWEPGYATHLGGGASDWLTNGGPADCTAVALSYTWRGGQQYAAVVSNTIAFAAGGAG